MARPKTPPLPDAPALYLLHLEAPVGGHAVHYLGECDDLARRIRRHRRGAGAKLLAAARALGIGWRLVRTWDAPADKAERLQLERRLKNAHGPRLCPACNPRALRWGTLTRQRVSVVKWPRPRRYGRFLDDGPQAPAPSRRGEPVTLPVPLWARDTKGPRPGGHPDRGEVTPPPGETTMKRIPQRSPRQPARHSTVRVTGLDGTTYQGDGEGLALAMRDLGRKHRAGQPAAAQGETRWRVTPAGEAYLAGLRGTGAAGPAVPVAALRRLLAELDGWPARPTNLGDALDRLSGLLAAYGGEACDRDDGEAGR